MSAFLIPTDLDLCPHPQTHLSFGCCTVRVTWKPTFPDFQKKSSPSGLYIVLDQGVGTKLTDLVVIALGYQIGIPGSNPNRDISRNCPIVVSFLERLFVMHKQNHSHHNIAAELFNICPFKTRCTLRNGIFRGQRRKM